MIPTFRLKNSTRSLGQTYAYESPLRGNVVFYMYFRYLYRLITGALKLCPHPSARGAHTQHQALSKGRAGHIVHYVNYRVTFDPPECNPEAITVKFIGVIFSTVVRCWQALCNSLEKNEPS